MMNFGNERGQTLREERESERANELLSKTEFMELYGVTVDDDGNYSEEIEARWFDYMQENGL